MPVSKKKQNIMKNNDVSYEDFCNLVANEVRRNSTPTSVDKYLYATYKVILRQLKLNHRIKIKGFGTFEIKERKSGERLINNPKNNQKQIYYVEPKYSISFKAASDFDYSVNENDFKIIAGKKKRKSSKPLVNNKTKRVSDLLNIANNRLQKGQEEDG